MSELALPSNLGPTICRAVGIDAATVSRMVITLVPGEVTNVKVYQLMARGEDGTTVEASSEYGLVERGDDVSS